MKECTDKNYEKILYAYELGILSDEELKEFEIHQLDCDFCYNKVKKFKNTAKLLRHDSDIRESIEQLAGESPDDKIIDIKDTTKFWKRSISIAAAAVIIFFLLIIKPWHIEFKPTKEAVAEANRLAVMYFDNLSDENDPQKLGEITTSLLIADLSESQYLQVVSSQRLHDILRLMGKEDSRITDKKLAIQISEKAGARWMLLGSIMQEEPELILMAQLVEVPSGIVAASQRITGEKGENIFSLVDKLTIQVKNELPLPLAALEEPDRQVAEVTTQSPLAYRYFLEGVVNYNRYYNTEAIVSFNKALEIDSTFAMVYYYLSLIENANLITKAVEYSHKASRKEGYLIRSQDAFLNGDFDLAIGELQESLISYPDDKETYYRIGICYYMILDFENAILNFKKAVEIDPLYKTVYNQMAYTYDWMWEFEKSIQAIDMYISLAPQEANPYDSRGDIYTRNGRLELAIDSYLKALEIKPDYWISLYKLGRNNLFLDKYDIADSCFRVLATCNDPSYQSTGMSARSYISLRQGRFNEAIRILDEVISLAKTSADYNEYAVFYELRGNSYQEKNNVNQALKEIEESIRVLQQQSPNNKVYNQHLLVGFLAQTDDFESAEKVAQELKQNRNAERDTLRHAYAVASIEYYKGNLEQAVIGFEKAAEDSVIPYIPANYMLAQTYLDVSRWSDALEQLDKILRMDFTATRLYYGNLATRIHYLKGIAHEELGHYELAIEQYQIFLDLWKNADPGITAIDDATKRLARLQNRS